MFHKFRAVMITASLSCLCACSGGGNSGGSNVVPQTLRAQDVAQGSVPTSTLSPVEAVRSSAFVDSVGINTHWAYPAYSRSFDTAKNLLVGLGIRHIRDGFVSNPASASVYFSYLKTLQSNGIRGTLLSSINMPVATIAQNVQALPNFVEAIEAPNEYDFSGDPLWVLRLSTYQQSLYQGVKANAQLSNLPVIGPSFGWSSSYGVLGNVSTFMDQGNMHNYFAGYNPGTAGWGGGGFGSAYGAIKYNLGAAAQAAGTKPTIATETGYCTVPNTRNAVSQAVQAKYIPRMFLEQWLGGVQRTMLYELLDEGGSGCNATYGLLTGTLAPKPSYYALKNFLSVVNDTDGGFQTKPLSMAFTAAASVHRLLLQKSNGSYVLAIWNEVSSWNVNNGNGAAVATTPVDVQIRLAANPVSSTVQTLNEDGTMTESPTQWQSGSLSVKIDDRVSLLTLMP